IARSIAVDAAGNAYIAGSTDSNDFPTVNPFQASIATGNDAFVAKLNSTGTGLLYSTYLGGGGNDVAYGIALNGSNAVVVGSTKPSAMSGFPILNAVQATNAGGGDAFVTELNSSGQALVFSTFLGGAGEDYAAGVAVSASGAIWVTGVTKGTFPTVAPLQASLQGVRNAFVAQITAAGAVVYSTYLGGSDDAQGLHIAITEGKAIALDPAGNAYIAGLTNATNFPTTAGALQQINKGGNGDAFVAKLNATGSALSYATYLGGEGFDAAYGLAVDGAGDAFVTGLTVSTSFPTANAVKGSYAGGGDAFVAELNPSGGSLAYRSY